MRSQWDTYAYADKVREKQRKTELKVLQDKREAHESRKRARAAAAAVAADDAAGAAAGDGDGEPEAKKFKKGENKGKNKAWSAQEDAEAKKAARRAKRLAKAKALRAAEAEGRVRAVDDDDDEGAAEEARDWKEELARAKREKREGRQATAREKGLPPTHGGGLAGVAFEGLD